MNVHFQIGLSLVATVLSLGLMTGCGQQGQTDVDQGAAQSNPTDADRGDEHAAAVDPHDLPLTDEQKQQLREETAKFVDAVAKIKEFRDVIQAETKDGLPANPLAAHQALDKADIVVQWLPKIAQDSNVPKEHWETINTTANELRELFDVIHENIDNKVDPNFTSVEQKMEAKISELEAIDQ